MKKLSLLIFILVFLTSACVPPASPEINIVPQKCKLNAGEEFPISLEGVNMSTKAEISWSATKGTIDPNTGYSVIYTAPEEPGSVIITAVLKAEKQYTTTLTCEVSAGPEGATGSASTTEPAAPPTETPRGITGDTIAITEVMSSPCGGGSGTVPNKNEYIELYNYGDSPVDVMNWWLATNGGGDGTPDQIVPWNFANPGVDLGKEFLVNDSVIPPGKYGIILSPMYATGEGKYFMPYAFPAGTILFSFSTSKFLGNDSTGLVGSNYTLTTIVLYKGSKTVITKVVSTYGTPKYGSSPNNVEDDKADKFPYELAECRSIERIDAASPDGIANWQAVNNGTPGSGNYNN